MSDWWIGVWQGITLGIALISWLHWMWSGFAYRGGFDAPAMPLAWSIFALLVWQL